MGKCLTKKAHSNHPQKLRSHLYESRAKSQEVFVKKFTIYDKENLKISRSTFITKQSQKIKDNYTFLEELGDGNYAKVYRAEHKSSNQIRAIKLIYKSKIKTHLLNNQNLLKEIEILKQLDHPNIVKLYEFYEDDLYYYLVTELCEGGELFSKIIQHKKFDEQQAAFIMKQLFSALQYLHVNNIVHRDLKPENLVLQSCEPNEPYRIKLIDFGTSQMFSPNEKMGLKLGTPYYIAPEILTKLYTYKCDIWSCGVILYILLSGKPPFRGTNETEILNKVKQGKYDLEDKV